jgi:two-component system, cell cycle sensor histidine kinase and response regulator CckA
MVWTGGGLFWGGFLGTHRTSGGQFLVNSPKQDVAPSTEAPATPVAPDPSVTEQDAAALEHNKEMELAEVRTEQAEVRTEQAELRTEEAEVRTDQAEARTDQAEARTELANTRTEQANTRTEQAEKRTDQANTRTDEANTRTEEAEARTAEAIRASELRYRRLFETAQDGILILDGDTGQVLDANPFMKDLLGYSQEEFLGKKLWEIGPFKGTDASKTAFTELQRTDRVRYGGMPLESKDGRRIEVEFVSNAYLVDQKRLIQCNIRDIAERKSAAEKITILNAELEQGVVERQLLEAQFIEVQKMEVVGQLAAGVAHDFNNILAVIMGYGDLLSADLGPDSPLLRYTEEIKHASDRAAGLTRQLLVFSRKQTVKPVVLDLNDAVRDMDKLLLRLIDENIEMKIVSGKDTGHVKADSGYIGQLLMNLVVNARDAMPNGGKLTIAINNATLDETYTNTHAGVTPGAFVMLSVSDTGTGISDDVKARLFEAFFTTKPKGKGTGLGLSTCQTIVQQSGGYIDVYSELGQGTTFKIYFPRVEQPIDAVAALFPPGPVPRGTETLLVVEDDLSLRHLARGVLETQGYNVLVAPNGQEALRIAREQTESPIRLVLSDVIMPQMGGREMAEHLKATNPELKVLFTSGYTDDTISHHGVLEAGVEFLAKPYTPAALAFKVRELLDATA